MRIARAEADYAVAREKCDDKAGNEKDVCIKAAKAAEVATKADAKVLSKTSDANNTANEAAVAARAKAVEQNAETRRDGAMEKRDADYSVAKEKRDSFADDKKEKCVKDAKQRYGQM